MIIHQLLRLDFCFGGLGLSERIQKDGLFKWIGNNEGQLTSYDKLDMDDSAPRVCGVVWATDAKY